MNGLCKGCVVKMKASSGMVGWGNLQCVSGYSEPLDEVSFYGHNQNYNDDDIAEIVEPAQKKEAETEPFTIDNKQSEPGCSVCGCRISLKGYCAGCQTRVDQ